MYRSSKTATRRFCAIRSTRASAASLRRSGSRLIDGAARKMADDFFRKFSEVVAPGQVEQIAAAPVAAKEGYERSGQYIIWIIVFAVLTLAIVLAL